MVVLGGGVRCQYREEKGKNIPGKREGVHNDRQAKNSMKMQETR